jgi:hypothetical protein
MSNKNNNTQTGETVSEDTIDASSPLNDAEPTHESVEKKRKWVTALSSIIGIMLFIGVLTGFIDVETLDKLSTCVNTLRLQNVTSSNSLNISSLNLYQL